MVFSIVVLDKFYKAALSVLDEHKEALTPAMRDLRTAIAETKAQVADRERFAAEIEKARQGYATDDLEIDDNPLVSVTDDSVWVAAWIRVPRN